MISGNGFSVTRMVLIFGGLRDATSAGIPLEEERGWVVLEGSLVAIKLLKDVLDMWDVWMDGCSLSPFSPIFKTSVHVCQ